MIILQCLTSSATSSARLQVVSDLLFADVSPRPPGTISHALKIRCKVVPAWGGPQSCVDCYSFFCLEIRTAWATLVMLLKSHPCHIECELNQWWWVCHWSVRPASLVSYDSQQQKVHVQWIILLKDSSLLLYLPISLTAKISINLFKKLDIIDYITDVRAE